MWTAVRAYHERSKHQLQRYAAGPETLDWGAQPDPFRRWDGAPLTPLPLVADTLHATWGDLHAGAVPPRAVDRDGVAALFELSFALTAWKQFGPDRWALRANPSSGNLHPTEAYLLAQGVTGLADGLYHYAPREHALEQRAAGIAAAPAAPCVWIGLSSIAWREAWKYGERAFRYGQLDAGHALGALRYAAAALGWQARVVGGLAHAELAALLGLDRAADFGAAEAEEAELLIRIGPGLPTAGAPPPWPAATAWHGRANRLDARPMYRWPVIDEVSVATRDPAHSIVEADTATAPTAARADQTLATHAATAAATLIRQRRSAQHFDRRVAMPHAVLLRIAQALLPGAGLPWDAWPHPARVHAVLFVHRVDGLASGAYVLPRSTTGATLLDELLPGGAFDAPFPGVPLRRIAAHPALAGTLRTLSCHQAIASDACLALSLLAEFEIDTAPSCYRTLLQEAGLIGQTLYLHAEAEGLRGTGIGCYFDDAVHELLGLRDTRLQVLYHFTVGAPLTDARLVHEAPYAGRAAVATLEETIDA